MLMDPAAMSLEAREDEEWVLRYDDDGFTYKILKRRRLLDPSTAAQPPVTDAEAEERRRKQRKKKTLSKLKSRYQKEIDQWELLSNNLRSMQDRANQQLELQNRQQDVAQTSSSFPPLELPSTAIDGSDNVCGSLIDKLLYQAEAQEAIIRDVSCLCDIAESMCNTQQEQLAQSYIDLPIWSSPRELMSSLCYD